MAETYPIALVLEGKAVLVVGGGEVATRKVRGLLDTGALITVVAPEVSSTITLWAHEGQCCLREKRYEAADLDGMSLVFVCTDAPEVNALASKEAEERGLLVNVADCPELCSFYLPSVLRRGKLSIAVSTEGSSPLTARKIRESLEDQFEDEIGIYLDFLQGWRARVIERLSEEARLQFWQEVSTSDAYDLIKQGDTAGAEALMERLLEKH